MADLAGTVPQLYLPNPAASAILTMLDHWPRRWSGTIAIVLMLRTMTGITSSLAVEQLVVIGNAHRLAHTVMGILGQGVESTA